MSFTDKHTSLLECDINYCHKEFYRGGLQENEEMSNQIKMFRLNEGF
jgi:hypothetical protein